MKMLVAVVLLSAQCQPQESQTQYQTTGSKFWVGNVECSHVSVEGMPCIYCECHVRDGRATSLTCDWTKHKTP